LLTSKQQYNKEKEPAAGGLLKVSWRAVAAELKVGIWFAPWRGIGQSTFEVGRYIALGEEKCPEEGVCPLKHVVAAPYLIERFAVTSISTWQNKNK
jgi:hypothetical protein